MRLGLGLLALGAGALLASPLCAEVLEVTGEFAANNREASLLHSVSVERFGGQDGPALALAIERALGGTPFELLAGRAGRERAEGAISGAVSTSIDEREFKKSDTNCVEKDGKGKCVKEEKVELTCRRRIISIGADIRMADNRSGRVLYSVNKPWREETSWCAGENPNRSVEEAVGAAIASIAYDVRIDIAPRTETYRIRVRETTKGLPKDAAARFRDLVELTKRDARGACAGWGAMKGAFGGHPSVAFNLGLCAEQAGQYEVAAGYYRVAAGGGAAEAQGGLDRTARLIAGREDAKLRVRR